MLAWLALDEAQWWAVLLERWHALGPRPFTQEAFEHALGYPWARPDGSFVLRDGEVTPLAEIEPGARREAIAALAGDRHPLVAFGANGAPTRLQERFGGLPDPVEREVLVLTGLLHEVDVGVQPFPTPFGTMPGALVASPGTAVRASVLWLTPLQLTILTRAELGYRLGRLDRARFEVDEAVLEVEQVLAYVSRAGALRLRGELVALAAIPATGRTARAMTQEELLAGLGAEALGPGTTAEDVVRACFANMPALIDRVRPVTSPGVVRLPAGDWTPYPVPPARR